VARIASYLRSNRQWFQYEMELSPSAKNRQNYLISFQYFLYYNKLYTNDQLANNVTVY